MMQYRFSGNSRIGNFCFVLTVHFHVSFELFGRAESNNTTGGNRDYFPVFGITAGALRFILQMEVSKTRKFDFPAVFKGYTHRIEE